ncbi:MAG: undecaprenyl-phosphate glucose phosphotransferase [Sedimentisphaerales bacterium]|nr:undecaprenyl-phosphate glucose phosphotransferase [Sedimentisphaerales bacterium]
MLKRYATFVSLFRSICDICMIACVWVSVFFFRFYSTIFTVEKGIPEFKRHIVLVVPVAVICYLSCLLTGLYKPKRVYNFFVQIIDIFKASLFSWLFVLAFFYYIQDMPYSRKLLTIFIIILFICLVFSHLFTQMIMRKFRQKGRNLRYYAVVGAGKKAQQLVDDIEGINWLGLKCVFFVDDDPDKINTKLNGIPIYGPIEKLVDFVEEKTVDEVYLALEGNGTRKVYPALKNIQSLGITVRIMPDWGELASITTITTINIGSNILFSATDSPLSGVNILLKEIFDRVIALILLFIFSIPILLIAVLVKLTSKGPVFYKQTRIGMDQKEFTIIKFRTMKTKIETEEKPGWTGSNDPRRTKVGAWLRRFSLDEIPQLINVLNGQMSLVGPRPERPVLAKQFSKEHKDYMFRHKVKAGMTGWAQVHDLRGDTSLRKRLLYDMYYVRNWSWILDVWILLQTPWHVIKGTNAH